jgi:hypothetical protein
MPSLAARVIVTPKASWPGLTRSSSAIHKIASLLRFLIFAMSFMKSRRLERDKVRSGTDNSKANWVRKMKYDELRRLAASAEKGSCVATSTAVTSEDRLPRRQSAGRVGIGISGTAFRARERSNEKARRSGSGGL